MHESAGGRRFRPVKAAIRGGKSIAELSVEAPPVTDTDLARRHALYELLTMPDPPDIHRGHILRFAGKPERHRLLPYLAAAFVQAKLLEIRERAPLDDMARSA
jgi:hypothetical protein